MPGNQRLKLLLALIVAQIGCLAAGLWIHYRFVVSAVYQAAEEDSLAELSPAVLARSLAAGGVITWLWVSVLLVVVVYMIVARLFDDLANRRCRAETQALRRIQSLLRTRDAVIFGLARLAESRDLATGRHLERICVYASRLAAAAGDHPKYRNVLNGAFMQLIGISSALHDIGKVGIEDAILRKPGRLSEAERARMQQHTTIGAKQLLEIEQRLGASNFLQMAREIAVSHHERWDGTGYPYGLAGEEIPLAARIVAVADVYDALSSPRPYKPALPHEECVEMICRGAGGQFDPELVEAFMRIEDSFRRIADQYDDPEPGTPQPAPAARVPSDPWEPPEPVPVGAGSEDDWAATAAVP